MKSVVPFALAFTLLGIGAGSLSRAASAAAPPATADVKDAHGTDGVHYRINREKSRFTAQVAVGGMLKGLGHPHVIAIRDFRGDVQASPRISGSGSLQLTIVAGSLAEVGKEIKQKDRAKVNQAMRQEALEVSRYPEVVFKSKEVTVKEAGDQRYEASIRGDLTLHGVTHAVSFPAKIRVEGNALRANGAFTILHSTYGIKRLSAGGGTIKAKDEIQLSFDIVADKD